MSHFAQINSDHTVIQVIVAEQDVIDLGLFGDPAAWIQTSYRTHGGQHPEGRPLRKNYASVGYMYDSDRDAFIPPKPYASWILNEETCLWQAPIARPQDNNSYVWSEDLQQWMLV